MSKKAREQKRRTRAWHRHYEELIAIERGKVAGYEQIAKMHSAYISILLKRQGATKNNVITITASEVKEALEKYEVRAIPTEDGYSLYCEVINDEIQAKATTDEREERN